MNSRSGTSRSSKSSLTSTSLSNISGPLSTIKKLSTPCSCSLKYPQVSTQCNLNSYSPIISSSLSVTGILFCSVCVKASNFQSLCSNTCQKCSRVKKSISYMAIRAKLNLNKIENRTKPTKN